MGKPRGERPSIGTEEVREEPMMKHLAASLIMLIASAAAAEEKTEGRLTAELTFGSIDLQGDGYVDQGEMERFRSDVFISMDTSDDGKVVYGEFKDWDPGFSAIAAAENKLDAYVTATKILFSFWDRDGDGEMSQAEMRFAVIADFRRADLNDDALLTEAEFLRGFSAIVAMRAAIRPDL